MHLLNPLQAPIYFVHSIQSHPCPILHNPNILQKVTKYACGRFFHFDAFRSGGRYLHPLPNPSLHCIFIPSATSARKARVLRTLALYCKSQSFYKINHPFLILKIEQHTYAQKIKKKAKVSGSPLGCKVKMYF